MEAALEEFELSIEEEATKELQWLFIVKAIAENESLKLTQEEFSKFLAGIVESRQTSFSKLMKEAAEDKKNGDFSPLHEEAMEQKVSALIRSQAKIIEVPRALEALEDWNEDEEIDDEILQHWY